MSAERTVPAVRERADPVSASAFGVLLRRYRVAAGLTQEALAERARMSAAGISTLESGKRQTPQSQTVDLLADALGLTAGQRVTFSAARRVSRSSNVVWMGGIDFAAERVQNNLPQSLTSFVGREQEIADISALVRQHRLVTLTGAGGVGKTRCALEVGARLLDLFSDGVWFVDLAPLRDATLVAAAVLRAINLSDAPNRPALETSITYLKRKSVLLIVDNCEHVIEEAATTAEALLMACPGVKILATSRALLRTGGERAHRLPSMSSPPAKSLRTFRASDVDAYASLALFVDRARAADDRFRVTNANAPIIAEICRRLDGIPLAIELAAARVTVLPVKALSEQLERRFAVLTAGERTALPRQQTMRALIDWSYDLLSPEERRLFEVLSVFAGGCTFDAAVAVSVGPENASDDTARDHVFGLLSSLVDKSLVQADVGSAEPRFLLLDSFSEYAHEALVARGEFELVARRHASVYAELGELIDRETEPHSTWFATEEGGGRELACGSAVEPWLARGFRSRAARSRCGAPNMGLSSGGKLAVGIRGARPRFAVHARTDRRSP